MSVDEKKPSRLERHKQRREGEVTNTNAAISSQSQQERDQLYEINPISAKKEKEEAKRKRSYNNIVVSKSLDIDEIRKKASGVKKELFDIEEAFDNLRKENKTYDRDTEVEIMNDLFSDNLVEYNDTIELQKDHHTKKITISEEDLIKMLDKKTAEKALQNKNNKKNPKISKKSITPAQKVTQAPKKQQKEDLMFKELDGGNRPVVEVLAEVTNKKPDHSMTQRINLNLDKKHHEKKEKPKQTKQKSKNATLSANAILTIILIALVLMFFFLVYKVLN